MASGTFFSSAVENLCKPQRLIAVYVQSLHLTECPLRWRKDTRYCNGLHRCFGHFWLVVERVVQALAGLGRRGGVRHGQSQFCRSTMAAGVLEWLQKSSGPPSPTRVRCP